MANPTGFLKYGRELPTVRPVEERLKDFNEFTGTFSVEALHQQSGRCMQCGVPFCHNGCPLGNLIPDFNDAVYRQQWKRAYDLLCATNNFPEFTGRICPAPCESACVLGINQPAVTIEEIEKHVIEIAFKQGFVVPKPPLHRTDKKVAVVGSGPAGLAVAAQLNSSGHAVTVFEKSDAPGGLLRYGIPDFKLEKWVIDRRISILIAEGIQFRCNVDVGKDLTAEELLTTFDAIVLAGGSSVPRDLNVEGRNLKGIYLALDFLTEQNKVVAGKMISSGIDAAGKHVVVIGGGDTGSDCVGTSNRQGALSVTQLELLPTPPLHRTAEMPWPTYPMLLKTTSSHEEGAERAWAIMTKEFLGNEAGELCGLRVAEVEWQSSSVGKPASFVERQGSERIIPCDLVFLAMGFLHPAHQGLLIELQVALDPRGNVEANPKSYQTNLRKVFAAGDMRRGQSLVVWAIAEGRECARKVDEYLMGASKLGAINESMLSI